MAVGATDYAETARALLDLAEAVATDTPVVRRGEAKGLNQNIIRAAVARVDEEIPEDDGVPPGAPTGVAVEVGRRQLIVSWAEPPAADYVDQTRVVITRDSTGSTVRTQWTRSSSITVPELDPYRADGTTRESYVLKIVHFDRWGRQSAITFTSPAMPLLSVADEVDFAALEILGRLQGELPNANLATLEDAILLGDGIVQARSMTAMDAAALNLWVQDAAIESAKVKNLQADKISTGILSVAVELNSAGRIKIKGSGFLDVVSGNPEVRHLMIDATGLQLRPTANFRDAANNDRNAKITPISGNPKTAISFLDSVASGRMGVYFRAEGTSTQAGTIALDALAGSNSDVNLMPGIQMEAGTGVTNRINASGPRFDISVDNLAIHSPTVNFDEGLTANKQIKTTGGGLDISGISVFRDPINLTSFFDGTTDFAGTIRLTGGAAGLITNSAAGIGARIVPALAWGGFVDANTTISVSTTNTTTTGAVSVYAYNGAQWDWCDRSAGLGQILWVSDSGTVRIRNPSAGGRSMQVKMQGN